MKRIPVQAERMYDMQVFFIAGDADLRLWRKKQSVREVCSHIVLMSVTHENDEVK